MNTDNTFASICYGNVIDIKHFSPKQKLDSLRVFGSAGAGNGHFNSPVFCALDDEGNLVVSDQGNHRIQVLRYSDGAHLRTIGSQGAGNGQFSSPVGIAFDGAGHILATASSQC